MSLPIEEQWRPIPGFPGYQVSSLGRILSTREDPDGRILRGSINQLGYPAFGMRRDGKFYSWTRHRAVALAFLGPRPEGLEVRHLDGDKTNCAAGNLVYGTASENAQDRLAHGRNPMARKTHCPKGHPYDETNTYIIPATGSRSCRACIRLRRRAPQSAM